MSAAALISEPSWIQYLVFTPEREGELKEGKNALLVYYGKDAQEVSGKTLGPEVQAAIKKGYNVVVLLHAHGLASVDPNQQALYTDGESKPDQPKSAQAVAKLLDEEWHLPKLGVDELRLIACYSDGFAQKLAMELGNKGYQNLKIVGYKGELNVNYGINGGTIAGLSLDRKQDSNLYILNHDKIYEINWKEFKKNKGLQQKYAAEKFAVRANTTPNLELQATPAAAAASDNTQPAAAASHSSAAAAGAGIQKAPATVSRRGNFSESSSVVQEDTSQSMHELNRDFSNLQLSGSAPQPFGNSPKTPASRALLFNNQRVSAQHKQNTAKQPDGPSSSHQAHGPEEDDPGSNIKPDR